MCMYVCMYVYIHTYIRVYTHICIYTVTRPRWCTTQCKAPPLSSKTRSNPDRSAGLPRALPVVCVACLVCHCAVPHACSAA